MKNITCKCWKPMCSGKYHIYGAFKGEILNSFINSEVCHPCVCRKTNVEVNISHENTTMVVWIYDGV